MDTDDKLHQIQYAKSTLADPSWIISAAFTPSTTWDITEYNWDTKEKVLYIKVYSSEQWSMICDYISATRKQVGEPIGDDEMDIRCWYSLEHWKPTSSDHNLGQDQDSAPTHPQK